MMRLKEGDPEGFSEHVNWLLWNKFFLDRDEEGRDEIVRRSEAGNSYTLACTKP
jgi:hypothetical protein